MKRRWIHISTKSLMLSSALLCACGSSSSVKKWNQQQAASIPVSQVKQADPNAVTPAPIVTTTVLPPVPLPKLPQTASAIADIASIKETSSSPNWVENQPQTIKGTAALLIGSPAFDVVMVGAPSWLKLTTAPSSTKGQISWQIQGTPPLEFTNGEEQRVVSFYLQIKTSGSLAADVSSLIANSPSHLKHLVTFNVNHSNAGPLVTSLKGLSLGQSEAVQEGTTRSFTVEVSDAGAVSGQAPQIEILKGSEKNSTEAVKLDAHDFVKVDPAHPSPEKIGASKWRFYFLFDAKQSPLPRPTVKAQNSYDDEANMNFNLHITSSSKLDSLHPVTFNVKYDTAKQAPKIKLSHEADSQLKLGQTNTVAFEVSSDLPQTTLSVDMDFVDQQLKKLGNGKGQFKCKKQEEQKMICGLQIVLSCDEKASGTTQKLTLKASSQLGATSASSSFEQEFSFIKPQGSCLPSPGDKK